MGRPVNLFTGQWADLTLEEVATKAPTGGTTGSSWACWGDHFRVDQGLADPGYTRDPVGDPRQARAEVLGPSRPTGRASWRLRPHRQPPQGPILAGRRCGGDGDPEGVRRRAAQAGRGTTARAAGEVRGPDGRGFFTGSSRLEASPLLLSRPTTLARSTRGTRTLARRFDPIMERLPGRKKGRAASALEVHSDRDRVRLRDHPQRRWDAIRQPDRSSA